MNRYSIFLFVFGLALGSCCDEDFINPDYDFIEFAIDLTPLIDNFSSCANPIYTTVNATADSGSGTCLDNPVQNRWFKFQPNGNYMNVTVRVGGTEGTQTNSIVTMWDTDGVTQLTCNTYSLPDDDIYASFSGFVAGEWYYISVDVDGTASAGTFGICIATD